MTVSIGRKFLGVVGAAAVTWPVKAWSRGAAREREGSPGYQDRKQGDQAFLPTTFWIQRPRTTEKGGAMNTIHARSLTGLRHHCAAGRQQVLQRVRAGNEVGTALDR